MKVLYFYYYLFYKKILNDSDPKMTAIFAFSFSESLLINGVLNIFLAYCFCWALTKYYMLSILLILLLSNFFIFFTSKKTAELVKSKPKFLDNHKFSIAVTWLFFLITISTLFWTGDYVNSIIAKCH